MSSTIEAVRAEALFASAVQSSEMLDGDEVRVMVARTLRRFGVRGCAVQVAGEFGDHPETAVTRMAWALATIRTVYAARPAARSSFRPAAAMAA
jgi:hypothetical protein